MSKGIWKVLTLLTLLFLVACGGGDEEPTAVPATTAPTAAPTAVPPTAVPDPTAGFVQLESETLALTISHPADWVAEADDTSGSILLASDAALLAADPGDIAEGGVVTLLASTVEEMSFMVTDGSASNPVDVAKTFGSFFFAEGAEGEASMVAAGEPTAATVAGQTGAVQNYSGTTETGVAIGGNLYAIVQGERVIILLTAVASDSQAALNPVVEAMVNSISIGELPVAAEPTAEPTTEAVAEPTAEPEVVEEPAAVVGNPAVAPAPEATTTVWPSGAYIFSNANPAREAAIYNGQIWTVSPGGLVAYDMATGSGRKYTPLDGLPDIGTFSVEVCPVNGVDRLIVGTRRGLVLYDDATDGWESGAAIGFDIDTGIFDMACDAANNRLLLDHDDVSILDLTTGTLTSYTEDDNGLAWFSTVELIPIGTDVWATTNYRGASQIAADGTVTVYSEANANTPDDSISDVAQAPDGTFWFAASDGLFQRQSNGEYVAFTRDNSAAISYFGPSHIEFAPNGDMWLGFTSDICRFDPATGDCFDNYSTYSDPNLPAQSRISGLKLDADGNPYVSLDNGVAHFDGTAWTSYQLAGEAPYNFFSGLHQTSDGTIWVWGETLLRTDVDVTAWTPLADVYPNDMVEAADGSLWFATSSGIQLFDGQRLTKYDRYAENPVILPITYNAIELDSDGRVYVGGDGGYVIIEGEDITNVGETEGWDNGNIRDLLFADGVMYAATTEGLLQLDGETWTVLLDETYVELPSKYIAALALYPDGAIVLGTGTGLAYYQDGAVRKDPVVTGSVSDIAVLPSGEVYVTAFRTNSFFGSGGDDNNGLFYYNGVDAWSMRYTVAEGLPMESFRAVMVDNAGAVWVATGDSGLGGGLFRLVP